MRSQYLETLYATACENARKAGRRGDAALTERWMRIARDCLGIEERLVRLAERSVEADMQEADLQARVADITDRAHARFPAGG